MALTTKIAALLVSVRRQDVEMLPPIERKRLADLCLYVADLAEPKNPKVIRGGVLVELKDYRRDE